MQQLRKNNLLAAAVAAIGLAASSQAHPEPSYWSNIVGQTQGRGRAHDAAKLKRHRRKIAKKSRQQQRRRAKGKD